MLQLEMQRLEKKMLNMILPKTCNVESGALMPKYKTPDGKVESLFEFITRNM